MEVVEGQTSLLVVEKEYECSCGCGQRAKGFVGPDGWFRFTIWEPHYPGYTMRFHELQFASRYCIRSFFKDWQPAPLKAYRGRQ